MEEIITRSGFTRNLRSESLDTREKVFRCNESGRLETLKSRLTCVSVAVVILPENGFLVKLFVSR